MSRTDERYSRQKDIVPSDRIAGCKATVIGVGAIGRQIALQLTAMGIPWLQLIDVDVVETSNLASQGYLEEDLGMLKVEATATQCRRINSGIEIVSVAERFRRSMEIGNAVFDCVDKIDVVALDTVAVVFDRNSHDGLIRCAREFDIDVPQSVFAGQHRRAV